jgi:peptide-methionine (R)-S-oxide reductase
MEKITKSEEEWKTILDPEQYRILRQKGTEFAGSGRFERHKEKGTYCCAGCGQQLFRSETKYNSGSGWPSFFDVFKPESVDLITDKSHGMIRVEVVCSRCGGHLGHVFDDGPQPTGMRYCINSASLTFEARKESNDLAS